MPIRQDERHSLSGVDRWEVIAAVGAELDLPEPVRFGDVHLGHPPSGARVQLPPDPVLPDIPGRHVVTLEQVTRINTSIYYWVVVDATSEDDALHIVERDVDPVVAVGLAIMLGHEVPTQILRVAKLGAGGPWSAWGGRALVRPLQSRRPERDELARLFRNLREDADIAGCMQYLRRATKYLGVIPTAGDIALDAALLEFARALEYLVRRTVPAPDASNAEGDAAARILAGLSATLSGNKSIRRKAAAVDEAARSLQRLERRTVNDSVRAFASSYDMGTRWTSTANRLVKVRNKHLAHPGAPMSKADRAALVQEPNGARSTVHDAVRAVTAARTGNDIPSAPAIADTPPAAMTVRWTPGPTAAWIGANQPGKTEE